MVTLRTNGKNTAFILAPPRVAKMQRETILTIGHSDHSLAKFLSLLKSSAIDRIVDVRSHPYSRRLLHFDKPELKKSLEDDGIAYFFLGNSLGGRPRGENLYRDGVADYEAMSETSNFNEGLDQVIRASTGHQVALMCSEHEPLNCHRCLLIGRRLHELGLPVAHILADGTIEPHETTERRLVLSEGLVKDDLFLSAPKRLELAYAKRANRVAHHQQPEIEYRRLASG